MKLKKVRNWISVIGILTACMTLTGCGHTHEWQEATCTTPKTCIKCNETEGEALGHTWTEATCIAPKTCSVCGETEGEALGHTLTEANYQQAATCEICKETVGEPLQADYEAWGIDKNGAELDKVYDFEISCYNDNSKTTMAKVWFSNYQTFPSDDTHEAKEGYEWKTVDINCVVGDDNALNFGYHPSYFMDDYYHWFDSNDAEENYFSVNYKGIDYSDCEVPYVDASNSGWVENSDTFGWNVTATVIVKAELLVPTGYDGCIYGIYNAKNWDGSDTQNADPNDYLYFRFQ